ncbi:YXWGXW repeat-containing protein [Terracidiphilus gabretensis]|uniref:YXWGXW repeat-containing protein n=1 Tax=Terracidiphilus gabretensis TaxID=1577687 RepID=UPI00071BDC17|nr:YXWGXW repeat-containing protein [Terracidiphilus gabretensis]
MHFFLSASRKLPSTRWLLLAAAVIVATAQHVSAQAPGTVVNGPFVWDGQQWHPVPPPAPPPPSPDQVAIYADDPPPPLPVYDQPPCPQPNLLWTPGYWNFGLLGYYWVPGAWVPAPYVGALWTPGYWGWAGGRYGFHDGYWGPHIGFYGGVNYGGGFMGIGFAGGAWNGSVFAYNTAVVRVNTTVITNVYVNRTIVEQTTIINNNHLAFNGGPNGIQHQPTSDEQTAMHETHQAPTSFQQQHIAAAKADTSNLVKNNGGRPTKLADTRPLQSENRPAPAGFKLPPQRPVTELAKVQAPPAAIAAAKTATTKTTAVAAVKPEAKPAAPAPTPKMAAKPEAKPATEPAPKMAPKPATGPAPKPAAKPETRPATEPAPKVAPRPATPAEKEPAAKPAPKEKSKPKPQEKKPEEKKPE